MALDLIAPEVRKSRRKLYQRRYEDRCLADPKKRERFLDYKKAKKRRWRERKKLQRIANPEPFLKYERAYRAANKEKFKAATQRFIARHPGYVADKDRKYRAANLEKCRAFEAAWRKKNADNVSDRAMRRRTRLANASIGHNCTQKIKILKQARFCHWCCAKLAKVTIDHVVPVSRGGEHKPDNLVAACGSCNYSRGNKLVSEWEWKAAA